MHKISTAFITFVLDELAVCFTIVQSTYQATDCTTPHRWVETPAFSRLHST